MFEKGNAWRFEKNNPGRPKGALNKATKVKNAFLDAFGGTGGKKELMAWIKSSKYNRKEFYKMLLQILPKEMKLEGDGLNQKQVVVVMPGDSSKKEQPQDVVVEKAENAELPQDNTPISGMGR